MGMETLHCFAEHLPPAIKERVVDLIAAKYMTTVKGGIEPLPPLPKKPNFLSERLHQLGQSYKAPSQEKIVAEMQQYESWLPAGLRDVYERCANTFGGATALKVRYHGHEETRLNQRMQDMFATHEEVMRADREEEKIFTLKMLYNWVAGREPPKATAPDLTYRVVAHADLPDYAMSRLQCIMQSTDTAHASTKRAIMQMNLRNNTPILCQVETHAWLSGGGTRSAFVVLVSPLPVSPYLRVSPTASLVDDTGKMGFPKSYRAGNPPKKGALEAKKRKVTPSADTGAKVKQARVSPAKPYLVTVVAKQEKSLNERSHTIGTPPSSLLAATECFVMDEDSTDVLGDMRFDISDLLGTPKLMPSVPKTDISVAISGTGPAHKNQLSREQSSSDATSLIMTDGDDMGGLGEIRFDLSDLLDPDFNKSLQLQNSYERAAYHTNSGQTHQPPVCCLSTDCCPSGFQ